MLFCLPTVLYDILSRKRHFRPVVSKKLPQLLTLVVGYDRLHLNAKINNHAARPSLNLDPPRSKKSSPHLFDKRSDNFIHGVEQERLRVINVSAPG
jgi:hypothetical protein